MSIDVPPDARFRHFRRQRKDAVIQIWLLPFGFPQRALTDRHAQDQFELDSTLANDGYPIDEHGRVFLRKLL